MYIIICHYYLVILNISIGALQAKSPILLLMTFNLMIQTPMFQEGLVNLC